MGYLSNGDFTFPFTWPIYALKQFFMWSYQSGSANPDGIIRMPGRLFNFLVFVLFGNLAFEYFMIFSSLVIVFICFFVFARYFLNIRSQRILWVTSLFYTLNPVFLGNLSKLGLVLAAGLLPLCLLLVKRMFDTQQVRYLFFWSLLLNISLIHPYTFAVNAAVSGSYFLYKASKDFGFIKQNILRLVGLCGVIGLLNLYFVLPMASVGTISKDVISSDASIPTDYTTIIDIANTGDVFTGLTLTKNVFVDYDFYNYGYEKIYLIGIFVLYVALFGTYLINQRLLKPQYKAIFALAVGSFLILVLMATVEFMNIDVIIKTLVGLPGGWMFRSPLKWQLYIPLSMCILMLISLATLRDKQHVRIAYGALAVSFVLINGYVGVQVFQKLLTPKQVTTFGSMQKLDMDYKNVLYINGTECQDYTAGHRKVLAELAQVFLSKNVQVKQYPAKDIETLNLTSFAYILTCQELKKDVVAKNGNYKLLDNYDGKAFQLYANTENMDYAYTPYMVTLDKQSDIPDKYQVVKNVTPERQVDFALNDVSKGGSATLQNVYEGLTFDRITKDGGITSTVATDPQNSSKLLIKNNLPNVYYVQNDGGVVVSPQATPAARPVQNGAVDLPRSAGKPLQVTYRDTNYDYRNLISNPSFEAGGWQKEAARCYVDKDMSDVSMEVVDSDKTDGAKSLELSAQDQIACTMSADVPVVSGQRYLLQFDYKSSGRFAGYRVTYDHNESEDINPERFSATQGDWETFSRDFVAPASAKTMRVTLYAYPDNKNKLPGVALYDNFKLAKVPDITRTFYAMGQVAPIKNEAVIRKVMHHDPTRKTIQVHTGDQPFNIVTRDSYSTSWIMSAKNGGQITGHFKDVSNTNSWYVQPAVICGASNGNCTKNPDGTYDMTLTVNYEPQRWFVVGSVISGLTALGVIIYFARGVLPKKQITKPVWRARRQI